MWAMGWTAVIGLIPAGYRKHGGKELKTQEAPCRQAGCAGGPLGSPMLSAKPHSTGLS